MRDAYLPIDLPIPTPENMGMGQKPVVVFGGIHIIITIHSPAIYSHIKHPLAIINYDHPLTIH